MSRSKIPFDQALKAALKNVHNSTYEILSVKNIIYDKKTVTINYLTNKGPECLQARSVRDLWSYFCETDDGLSVEDLELALTKHKQWPDNITDAILANLD